MIEGDNRIVFVGTYGNVRAVDMENGNDVWTTSLPGTGYQLVTLLYESGTLLAGSKGKLFALDGRTGAILWSNSLEGLGYDHMTLATVHQSSRPPVEAVQNDRRSSTSGTSNGNT